MSSSRRMLGLATGMLGLVLVARGAAQDKTEAAPEKPVAVQAPPVAAGNNPVAIDKTPKIVGVRSGRADSHLVDLDDDLFVKVTNLPELVKNGPVSLYLSGRQVPVDEPEIHYLTGELKFRLVNQRTPESKKAWHDLLEPLSFTRIVSVRVGPANGPPLAFDKQEVTIKLIVVPQLWFWTWVGLFAAGVLTLVWLAKRTTLLRASSGAVGPGQLPRYSLARVQMAFWTVLVLGSYVFLWLVMDEADTLTASAVALIGISGSTALGAVLVDSAKRGDVIAKLAPLQQEPQAPPSNAATAVTPPASAAGGQQVAASPSVGFLIDILTDSSGLCLHRVQMFLWTLVLGVVAVNYVYQHLEIPEFDGTLLALMGVSSGTYIGFKFPEKGVSD